MRDIIILTLLVMFSGYIGLEAMQSTNGYDSLGLVSCGCHEAPSCVSCGRQPYMCNGDCTWTSSGCVFKEGNTTGSTTEASTTGNSGGSSTLSCNCGVKPTKKIVNGQDADEFEWPWIARLDVEYDDGTFLCGGTLIADQWIVTATHCTVAKNGKLPTVTVYLGDHDQGQTDTNEKIISVSKIINHAEYYEVNGDPLNDISLLKLSEKVDMTKYSPVCLPEASSTYVGKNADVYGWGTTSYGGLTADILKKTKVEVVTNSACTVQGYDFITPAQICAYTAETDSCQGDSGGPLTYNNNNKHEQIGVVSYGHEGCAATDKSGVYSRVTEYLGWIKTQTGNNGGAVYCDNA